MNPSIKFTWCTISTEQRSNETGQRFLSSSARNSIQSRTPPELRRRMSARSRTTVSPSDSLAIRRAKLACSVMSPDMITLIVFPARLSSHVRAMGGVTSTLHEQVEGLAVAGEVAIAAADVDQADRLGPL